MCSATPGLRDASALTRTHDSLLAAQGQLTALGQEYITLPIAGATAPATTSMVLIDSGSSTAQGSFAADTDVSGGSEASSSNAITIPSGDTASQAVYQTNRFGNFTYTIGGFGAGSAHTVTLHFAETYWPSAGQRVFNVILNGSTVLPSFDIVANAGASNTAIVKTFNTTANSAGQIAIQFSTVKDNAQVNGVEIH